MWFLCTFFARAFSDVTERSDVDVFFENIFCQQMPQTCGQQVSIPLEVASGFGFPLELAQT